MSLKTNLNHDGTILNLVVEGRFDYRLHEHFKSAFESLKSPVEQYIIDFERVEDLDSSAISMLLMLKDHIHDDNRQVQIINASDNHKRILKSMLHDSFFYF